jgi:hypothetical protein
MSGPIPGISYSQNRPSEHMGLAQHQAVNIILLPANTDQPKFYPHSSDSETKFHPLPRRNVKQIRYFETSAGDTTLARDIPLCWHALILRPAQWRLLFAASNFSFARYNLSTTQTKVTERFPLSEQLFPRCNIFNHNIFNQWQIPALTLLAHCAMLACWLMALTLRATSAQQ